ncbi:MAG: hypothetical protein M1836_003463 [Candelina mexicana]|nr:MAG: hypothetical protein M1836_003463 [Candelina mexicana]
MLEASQLSNPPKLIKPSAEAAEHDIREPGFRNYLSFGLALGLVLILIPVIILVLIRCWRASRWRRQYRPTTGASVPFYRRLHIRRWLLSLLVESHSQSPSYESEVTVRPSPLFIDPHPPLPLSLSGIAGPPSSPAAGWGMLEDRPSNLFGKWPIDVRRYDTPFDVESMARGCQSARNSVDNEVASGGYAPATTYHMRWWGRHGKVDNEEFRRNIGSRSLRMSYPWQWMIGKSNWEQEEAIEDEIGARLPMSSATFYAHLNQDLDWNRRQLKPGGPRLHPVTRAWLGPVVL